MDHSNEIIKIIERINNAWLKKETDKLNYFFHKDIVIASQNFDIQARGIEKCIKSYKDFVNNVEVHEFNPDKPEITISENTAVALYSFDISYTINSERINETGKEFLVLTYNSVDWKLVWRIIYSGNQ